VELIEHALFYILAIAFVLGLSKNSDRYVHYAVKLVESRSTGVGRLALRNQMN